MAAEKTMALGAVATGNMKAYEQLTVAGNIKYSGLILIVTDCNHRSIMECSNTFDVKQYHLCQYRQKYVGCGRVGSYFGDNDRHYANDEHDHERR